MTLPIGKTFNNQYEIISELWSDGISTSYKAYDVKSQTHCEIQEINLANLAIGEISEFLGISLIQSSMEFEYDPLVKVQNIISSPLFNNRFYVVKEFYETTLQEGRVYKERQAVEWVSQIAYGLLQIKETSSFFAKAPMAFKQINLATVKTQDENVFLDFYAIIDFPHLEAQRSSHAVERTPAYVLGALLFTLLTGRNLPNRRLYREVIVRYFSGKQVTSKTIQAIIEALIPGSNSFSEREELSQFFNKLQGKEIEKEKPKHMAHTNTATSGCMLPMFFISILIIATFFTAYLGRKLLISPSVTKIPTAIVESNLPSATLTSTPVPFELVKNYEIQNNDIVGELSINYPLWLEPGSGELVKVLIQVPGDIANISVVNGNRIDLPATATPFIGELALFKAIVIIDDHMRVELESSTIAIQARTLIIQDVETHQRYNPTLWIWAITAPNVPGKHRLDISVFLDEYSQQPSWFQSYQVKVVEPTNTPEPSDTPTLTPFPTTTPSRTPSPTPTLTLTPTPSYYQSMVDNARSDPWKAISACLGIPAVIALILAAILKILLPYLRWRQRVKELESDKDNTTGAKKKAIEKELNDMKKNWFNRIWIDEAKDKDNK